MPQLAALLAAPGEPGGTASGDPGGDRHVPVMLAEVVDVLAPAVGAARDRGRTPQLLDGTLGLAGHTIALLRAFPDATVTGVDRDPQALRLAAARVADAGVDDRFDAVRAVYDELPDGPFDGALFDLGVSSLQLDEVDRGFSYARDAPLDMRMDPTTGPSAADVVNSYGEAELARVLRTYGEERFAARIARGIVSARSREPFTSSARLVEVVRDAIPAAARRTGGNPSKRTFQALRIEVNDELGALRRAVPAALDRLAVSGRIAVLTYHSLEDRIVKRGIGDRTTSSAPPGLPFEVPGSEPAFRWVVKGATPDEAEIERNPRAASARLRAAERIRKGQG